MLGKVMVKRSNVKSSFGRVEYCYAKRWRSIFLQRQVLAKLGRLAFRKGIVYSCKAMLWQSKGRRAKMRVADI